MNARSDTSLGVPDRFVLHLFLVTLPCCAVLCGCGPRVPQADPKTVARVAAPPSRAEDSGSAVNNEVFGEASADPALEQNLGFLPQRQAMVDEQLRARNITDKRVLDAMLRVPRHQFVPREMRRLAYRDSPLPIGEGQTISQPYMVALMTQLARPRPSDRALDVGTGSAYQAAVLGELVKQVYSVEIVRALGVQATERLEHFGYANVEVRIGDGYRGWAEHAPFDIIIVAAAPDHIPDPLIAQLAPGGRMVLPVGRFFQTLVVVEKDVDGTVHRRKVAPVAFVPMTGEAERAPEAD